MKRKAIRLANQTIVVSLPAKWVKQQGIKKGDEIDVEEENENLIIKKLSGPIIEKKTEINVSKLSEPIIWRYIGSIYRSGCDEVKIIFDNHNTIKLINEIADNLIGFEIVEQKSNKCTVKDISGIKGEEFDNILKRIFFILISGTEEFMEITKKQDLSKLNILIDLDKQVNKFTDYALRLLSKSNIITIKKHWLCHIIIQLEHIADLLKISAQNIISTKKFNEYNSKLLENFYECLTLFYEIFYNFQPDKFVEMNAEKLKAMEIWNIIKSKKINGAEKETASTILSAIYGTMNLSDCVFALSI